MREATGVPEPTLTSVAGRQFACPCGRIHTVSIETIANHPGAEREVAPFLEKQGVSGLWLIADEATYEASGRAVEAGCRARGLAVHRTILPAEPPSHPDREALGRLALDLQPDRCPLVAVGAGTVTDLARFLAHRVGTFFVAVPTAPSMDGFASSVAALVVDGVRITYPARAPRAIFADPTVFGRAPAELIAAGHAEMLGKLTALADWRLAHGLNGEYHCPLAEELVLQATRRVLPGPSAPEELMEGLLWVGLAMLMVGNSRPASGSEHHLAHYWEMRALWEGREPHLHGQRVGVASVLVQRVYRELFQRRWALVQGAAGRRARRWPHAGEAQIRAWFGPVARRILAEQASWPSAPYGPQPLTADGLAAARDHLTLYLWPPEEAETFLRRVGAPALPQEVGLDPGTVQTSLLAAKEVRNRFTVLHLAAELGLLEEVAEAVAGPAGTYPLP